MHSNTFHRYGLVAMLACVLGWITRDYVKAITRWTQADERADGGLEGCRDSQVSTG